MLNNELSQDQKNLMRKHNKSSVLPTFIATWYDNFLRGNNWMKDHEGRQYLVNFVRCCRKFRQYWYSIRVADRVNQEYIFIQWISVFVLLNKNKYVSILFNTIEKEYGEITYEQLEEIRRNAYVRFNSGVDKDDRPHTCVALDECQEIINFWTKKLPIKGDEKTWVEHSKNLMFSRKCINYQREQHMRHHLCYRNDYDDQVVKKNGVSHGHIRSVEPRKVVEKSRMYEFIVKLVENDLLMGVQLLEKHGYEVIDKLECEFNKKDDNDELPSVPTDHLSQSIEALFDYENETNSPDNNTDTNNIGDREEEVDDESGEDTDEHIHKLHRFALVDVFDLGNKELIQQNILSTRHRRKRRLGRVSNYFIYVHTKVNLLLKETLSTVKSLSSIGDQERILNIPTFREKYNQ